MNKIKVFLLFLIFLGLTSCGYKPVYYGEKPAEIYCIKSIKISTAEATALDVLTKNISEAVISSKNKLECSEKTEKYIVADVKSIKFEPIGFSQAQRANIFKMKIDMDFTVENKEGKPILKTKIKETTQYVGAGLRADFERRYALEELAHLVRLRVFSLLSSKEYGKNQ
jgi:hypothetical protein